MSVAEHEKGCSERAFADEKKRFRFRSMLQKMQMESNISDAETQSRLQAREEELETLQGKLLYMEKCGVSDILIFFNSSG